MRAKAVAEQTQHERKRRKIDYRKGLERAQEQAPASLRFHMQGGCEGSESEWIDPTSPRSPMFRRPATSTAGHRSTRHLPCHSHVTRMLIDSEFIAWM